MTVMALLLSVARRLAMPTHICVYIEFIEFFCLIMFSVRVSNVYMNLLLHEWQEMTKQDTHQFDQLLAKGKLLQVSLRMMFDTSK